MHSHFGFQIQQLMSAPLIILNPENKTKEKNVVMLLTDFSFKSPEAIYHELTHRKPPSKAISQVKKNKSDLIDVRYDAFLTNYYTLAAPEIVRVKPGERVRLRIISGGAMTNFAVNTGKLPSTAIAVDGERIQPLSEKNYEIPLGERMDILVKIPQGQAAYPILAQGEGTDMQTGLILATNDAKIPTLSETTKKIAPAFTYQQEWRLKALHPLAIKPIQQVLHVNLEGNMAKYQWEINHQIWPNVTPLVVKPNTRVELIFNNQTGMAHPMHLHGHVFEVTAINGQPVKDGALHDTILILPHSTVTVQFDANNPGNWLLHCHMLYHSAAGMMTLLTYQGQTIPSIVHNPQVSK